MRGDESNTRHCDAMRDNDLQASDYEGRGDLYMDDLHNCDSLSNDYDTTVAAAFEKNYVPVGYSSEYQGAYDEVYKLRNDNGFLQTLNKVISDDHDANSMLSSLHITGFDADGDMRLEDNFQYRFERDRQGHRREIWGSQKDGRAFVLNADGSANHEVKTGDTIWSIARAICIEQKKDREPTPHDVNGEVYRILAANPQLREPNHLRPGRDVVKIPKVSVDVIMNAYCRRVPHEPPHAVDVLRHTTARAIEA